MSQDVLLLLVVAISGVYAVNWARRLAPLASELPLKTLLATLLAGGVAAAAIGGSRLPDTLTLLAMVIGPLYVFGPLAVVGLARARRYLLAEGLAKGLYWSPVGRSAASRLLTQVALQQGDADAALRFVPDGDPLMLAQAHALRGDWQAVLEQDVPRDGDNGSLGDAARVEALIALGRIDEAERTVAAMRDRWQAQGQGPIGFRSLTLSEARLAAERGALDTVRESFRQPLAGVPSYLLLGILARAAERAGRFETALDLYAQGYALAPASRREPFESRLLAAGRELPKLRREVAPPYGTYALTALLALAFVAQMWLDGRVGQGFSAAMAGFLLNQPNVPESDASWRLLSTAFVHGGLIHIGFNLWVLIDIGRLFETRRGWGNLLAAFVLGAIMGAYITGLAQGGQRLTLVGASGGVLGIAGALLADVLRGRSPSDRTLTRSLLQWMVLIVLFSVAVPNVSLWGHVGGVLGGMLWGFARQGLPFGPRFDLFVGGVSIGLMVYTLLQVGALVARVGF